MSLKVHPLFEVTITPEPCKFSLELCHSRRVHIFTAKAMEVKI